MLQATGAHALTPIGQDVNMSVIPVYWYLGR
jgi:hypothetical protein